MSHLESYRGSVSTVGKLSLERMHEVVDFLIVNVQIAVSRNAKLIATVDTHAGEQFVDKCVNDRR